MVMAGDRVKAAVYLRVSSRDGRQDEANQEPECLELCRARGWEPVVFRERESAVKARPVWREVLELARLGRVRAVVVWALDGIGRTRVQVAHDLAELLRWRVDVVSVRDGWLDQAGPMRELLVQIFGWVAEGERQRLIERTHAGLARARARGKSSAVARIPPEAVDCAGGAPGERNPVACAPGGGGPGWPWEVVQVRAPKGRRAVVSKGCRGGGGKVRPPCGVRATWPAVHQLTVW